VIVLHLRANKSSVNIASMNNSTSITKEKLVSNEGLAFTIMFLVYSVAPITIMHAINHEMRFRDLIFVYP